MVQRCLKKVKYKSSWEIVKLLYQISGLPKIEEGVVVSVPMWRQKERMRGFNQAAIIAELIAKDNGLKQIELLERVRETKPMYGLDKQAREVNVNGAFRIKQNLRDKLVGARVILVDDVWTTGATMKECGKLLKSAGVREIWAITLAR
jgi:ComF family protein